MEGQSSNVLRAFYGSFLFGMALYMIQQTGSKQVSEEPVTEYPKKYVRRTQKEHPLDLAILERLSESSKVPTDDMFAWIITKHPETTKRELNSRLYTLQAKGWVYLGNNGWYSA